MGSLMDHHTGNSISNMYDQIGVNRRAMILRDPVWTLLQESNYLRTRNDCCFTKPHLHGSTSYILAGPEYWLSLE